MRVLLKAADCAFWLSQAVLFCSNTEAVVVYHSFAYWSLLDCRAATQALSHPEDESSEGSALAGFEIEWIHHSQRCIISIFWIPSLACSEYQKFSRMRRCYMSSTTRHAHCPGDSQRTLWTLMLALLPRVFVVQLPGWTCARQAGPSAEVGTWDFLILSDTFMSDIWLLEIVKLLICPCVLLGLTSFNDSTGGLHPSMRRWNSHHAHGRVWWQ